MPVLRKCVSIALSAICAAPLSLAQEALAPVKPNAIIMVRPYRAPYVPPARLSNGSRLGTLIRAGKLYLTAQDAISLALENNIDIETDRYNALVDVSQLQRSQAGGALPGVPSATSQASTVASGEGVTGSQSAAGVSNTGNSGSGGSSNTTITQIGAVTPTLDPVIQDVQSYAHLSQPGANLTQSGTFNLVQNIRNYNENISQGLITGGQATLSYTDSYLNEKAATDLLDPQSAPALQLQIRHNFLFGFGTALNSRNITIAKANLQINDLNFNTEVISTVVNVLNLYYGLVADYEDLKAKQSAQDVAQRLFEDNKRQVQIGTMAQLDVTTAEAQLASSQYDLITSQTNLQEQQVSLKNVLSRNGLGDPQLKDVEIIPLDRIDVPTADDLPPYKEMINTALANRADLASDKLNFINSQTSTLGTKNEVLPILGGVVTLKNAGLAGTPHIIPLQGAQGSFPGSTLPPGFLPCPASVAPAGTFCEAPPPPLEGGIGKGLGQVLRRDFPTESGTAYFANTFRNQQAQADYALDQLGLRQTELQNVRTLNQVAVDVSNQSIALRQARVRYLTAVKNRTLDEQLLQAEQKKFALGASTTYLVVQQQSAFAAAQSAEIASLVAYINSRIALDQTLGTTLKANNVSIQEAQSGLVARKSALPETLPQK